MGPKLDLRVCVLCIYVHFATFYIVGLCIGFCQTDRNDCVLGSCTSGCSRVKKITGYRKLSANGKGGMAENLLEVAFTKRKTQCIVQGPVIRAFLREAVFHVLAIDRCGR